MENVCFNLQWWAAPLNVCANLDPAATYPYLSQVQFRAKAIKRSDCRAYQCTLFTKILACMYVRIYLATEILSSTWHCYMPFYPLALISTRYYLQVM